MSSSATNPTSNDSRSHSPALVVGLIVSVLCVIAIGGLAWGARVVSQSKDHILPNISVAQISLGGLDITHAQTTLKQSLGQSNVQSLTLRILDKLYTLPADTPNGSFIEPSSELAQKAYAIGRSGNLLQDYWDGLRLSLGARAEVPLAVDVSPNKLQDTLTPKVAAILHPAIDAHLVTTTNGTSTPSVSIASDQDGATIDWTDAATRIQTHLNERRTGAIDIAVLKTTAALQTSDFEPALSQAQQWVSKPALALTTPDKTWTLSPNTIASWISTTSTSPHVVTLVLNPSMADATFRTWLGPRVRAAQDGVLELDEQGKLKHFVAPQDGFGPDTTTTLQNIENAWATQATTTALITTNQQPTIRDDEADQLGIHELIGRGTSDMSGSPVNRRKNIALGAERVNGTIIPPDGEFSLVKTLGAIDGEHGWLPELVIKDNKTTPDFGGGLCQIGTTAFRGAMNTGLPIIERQNHSYRVRYYEPAGTDATIYDPKPDFRFKNDTAHSILITTAIEGDRIEFSFWGTSDGRKATIGKSVITNITQPPPKKIIETLDLPAGKTKCSETAHAGATARVDYTVQYATGQEKKVTFTSLYKPWQAVCLLGVSELSKPAPTGVDQTGINNLN